MRRAKLRTCLLAAAWGKDRLKFGEILPYLSRRIDPKMAVRAFLRNHKIHTISLEEQIRFGIRARMVDLFNCCEEDGFLEINRVYERNSHNNERIVLEETEIILTQKAKDAQKKNPVWIEMKRAALQGLLFINVEVVKGDEE
jgi:hypothetical protein